MKKKAARVGQLFWFVGTLGTLKGDPFKRLLCRYVESDFVGKIEYPSMEILVDMDWYGTSTKLAGEELYDYPWEGFKVFKDYDETYNQNFRQLLVSHLFEQNI
jgi:hypothetical protein